MGDLFATSLSVGILSWLWAYLSGVFGLLTWVGFLGCTSYFAIGEYGFKGFKKSLIANFSGVLWAFVILMGSKYISLGNVGAILTGIFSFVMCYQARSKYLAFIPGTFIGACSTFGSNGAYIMVLISLVLGALVGYTSDIGGKILYNKFGKKEQQEQK